MIISGNTFHYNAFTVLLSELTKLDTFVITDVRENYEYTKDKKKTDKLLGCSYDLSGSDGSHFTLRVDGGAPLIKREDLHKFQEADVVTMLAVDTKQVTVKPYDVDRKGDFIAGLKVSIATTKDAVGLAD